MSTWTDNLSKFSVRFEFDRELFVSKVYERVFRGAVKNSLQRQPRTISPEDPEASKRTWEINQAIRKDYTRLKQEHKILVLGTAGSGKEDIINTMKSIHQNGYTTEEPMKCRYLIRQNIIDCAKALIETMRKIEIWPESEVVSSYCHFIQDYVLDPDLEAPLEDTVSQAINALWNDPSTAEVLHSGLGFYMMDSAS